MPFGMRVFEAATRAWQSGRCAALATVIEIGGSTPRSAGARMLIHADGETIGTIGGGAMEHQVISAAEEVMRSGHPMRWAKNLTHDLGMCCGGSVVVYIEPIKRQDHMTVFGAGHIAHAVVPILETLEFKVTVVDDRLEWNSATRFPNVRRVHQDPIDHLQTTSADAEDWHLVVTHDHKRDQDVVEGLLARPARWIGLVGSSTKWKKFQIRYRSAGLDPTTFHRVSCPVGLDIGSETPGEIAISVAAELITRRRRP
jgi:xanthine dehydrogenase accessory factor